MKTMHSKDFIQIRLESIVSSQDLEFLTEFYGPLIGLESLGLFLTLKQYEGLLDQEPVSLESWLSTIQTSPQVFQQARVHLEAVGLLRTYQEKFQDTQLYTLSLFGPKNPLDFFGDPLLKGMLLQRIGQMGLKRLETKYRATPSPAGQQEISASFGEVFHPDLNHPAFVLSTSPQLKGKSLATIRKPFDRIQFEEQLHHEFNLDVKKLHEEDLNQAVTIATLMGLDELAMANLFGTYLDANFRLNLIGLENAARHEKRLPFVKSRQKQKFQFQETSSHAILLNQLEMMAPVEYLVELQKGAEISQADFNLLKRLQENYHLENAAINALVYFVLKTQNNMLVAKYVEKLAAQLSRESQKLVHASDVLDYFYRITQPKPTTKPTPIKPVVETIDATTPNQDQPLTLSEDKLRELEEKLKGLK